ncbi:hypothetical protein EFK50_12715 [Nocardioides marmoriginsengisoli]|uniref:Carboxypeptidase regulatory-like domain-containing protein n=1 Tax=Nocardioides marmoriginsengisoli TaxID=661483 RepID=A0A3N0CGQ6_9ACTN|nr:hypothetical protein [Nocardioides marmoriginsengisoli]RNL62618.1 hypothetical protein EFK50_12715 [Nocardioides marmoriginsengisoli]
MKPALLLAVLALALTGCGGDEKPASTPSGQTSAPVGGPAVGTIEGRLLAVGGPAGTEDELISGKLRIAGPGGEVLRADIGADGRYAIQLSPGAYVVTATSPAYQGGKARCATDPARTTITKDETVTADVLCQRR